MKNLLFSINIVFFSYTINAQVGIGTTEPNIFFDVKENRENTTNNSNSKDGIIIPQLTKLELASKANNTYNSTTLGTLVFVYDISGNFTGKPSIEQVSEIYKPGFYYFGSNNRWKSTEGDTSDDIWSNNSTNEYVKLKSKANGETRLNDTNIVINDLGYVGINNNTPTKRLNINAAITGTTPEFIKFNNLKDIDSNSNSSTLVIDTDGNVYKNDVENISGQIMRIPISGYTAGTNTGSTQGSIRLDFESSNESPACFVNGTRICNKNFINTIKGVTNTNLLVNQTIINANTGTIPRITERIVLPKGVYKIQIRLNGYYSNGNETNGNTIVKLAVGNKEFSVHNYYDRVFGAEAPTSIIFTDYINLNQDDYVDFLMDNWNTKEFIIIPHEDKGQIANPDYNPNQPTSSTNPININLRNIKSMVLIERLR